MAGGGVIVAVVLGLLAVAAGGPGQPRCSPWPPARRSCSPPGCCWCCSAAGATGASSDGSTSTFALWLGLGTGLVVLGATPRDHLQ